MNAGEDSAAKFEVIPAIDLRAGRCVRLFQGDFDQETVYGDDPVSMARRWEAEGARRLHVVDLDGARGGRPVHLDALRRIAAGTAIPIQFGGGLRDEAAVAAALAAGAGRAIIGTAALDVEACAALCARFGERLAIGLDARNDRVAAHGWQSDTGRDAVETALQLQAAGARRIIFTEISRDGTLAGPSVEGTRRLAGALSIPVLASGGVGRPEDVDRLAALARIGVEGVIVGRALYTGAVRLGEWTAGRRVE